MAQIGSTIGQKEFQGRTTIKPEDLAASGALQNNFAKWSWCPGMITVTSTLGPLAHEAIFPLMNLDARPHEEDAAALGGIGSLSHRFAAALSDIR